MRLRPDQATYDALTLIDAEALGEDLAQLQGPLRARAVAILEASESFNNVTRELCLVEGELADGRLVGPRVSDATMEQLRRVVKSSRSDELKSVKKFLDQIMRSGKAWPFLEPVDRHLYPTYYEGPHAVMDPIDLGTIKMKLEQGSYADADAVKADVDRVWENCRHFNGETHLYSTMADDLERRFNKKFHSLMGTHVV